MGLNEPQKELLQDEIVVLNLSAELQCAEKIQDNIGDVLLAESGSRRLVYSSSKTR